jgi:hypothetical protein
MRATCPAYLILHDCIIRIVFDEGYNYMRSLSMKCSPPSSPHPSYVQIFSLSLPESTCVLSWNVFLLTLYIRLMTFDLVRCWVRRNALLASAKSRLIARTDVCANLHEITTKLHVCSFRDVDSGVALGVANLATVVHWSMIKLSSIMSYQLFMRANCCFIKLEFLFLSYVMLHNIFQALFF